MLCLTGAVLAVAQMHDAFPADGIGPCLHENHRQRVLITVAPGAAGTVVYSHAQKRQQLVAVVTRRLEALFVIGVVHGARLADAVRTCGCVR